jgi:hypothetical protein
MGKQSKGTAHEGDGTDIRALEMMRDDAIIEGAARPAATVIQDW